MSSSRLKKVITKVKGLGDTKRFDKYKARRNVDDLRMLVHSGCLSVDEVREVLGIFRRPGFNINDEDIQKFLQDLCTRLGHKGVCRICGSAEIGLGRKLITERDYMDYVACETCGTVLGFWFSSSLG